MTAGLSADYPERLAVKKMKQRKPLVLMPGFLAISFSLMIYCDSTSKGTQAYTKNSSSTPTTSITPSPAPEGKVIVFPDENIESAIRKAIDRRMGDIYQSELLSVTELGPKAVTGLTGLEYCTNLEKLDFNQWVKGGPIYDDEGRPLGCPTPIPLNTSLKDIFPLSDNDALWDLDLHCNQVDDIAPLIDMDSLSVLWLTGNPLNEDSVNVYIPKLKEHGVDVRYYPEIEDNYCPY